MPWFRKFGATDPGDDSANILNYNYKSYREAIYQNSNTIFDFRIYLFARQCHLLIRLEQPLQFLTRAHSFINTFSQTLKEYKVSLIPFFRESWTYSSCMAVVNAGDELVARCQLSAQVAKQCEALRASFLHLARVQVRFFDDLFRSWTNWV